ncbi:hypothetical protein [Reichenbachiella ulvae]|uniref:DUF4358 domain-containing protein n=1 Tax=Reichenbachiella ulvae TaxID=2980104 RepID=A0ABT3CT26_9BACT|nr:hypothetical protein [Reichenbachiella ulvae]MCV9386856.1 hypothetical protein [Reichenbachiella ulvae]
MKHLLFLILFGLFYSCGEGQPSAKQNNVSKPSSQAQTLSIDAFDRLVNTLIDDKYKLKVDTTYQSTIAFIRYSDDLALEALDSIKLQALKVRTIKAKSLLAVKGTDLYPRLIIKEATLSDQVLTDQLLTEIEGIINNQDLINEKIYDRIVKADSHRFIYLSTDAKAFEDSIEKYTALISNN